MMNNTPMRTLVAMVSVGKDRKHSVIATLLATKFARRHGYDFAVVHSDVSPPNRSIHYAKMQVLAIFENYDRYCIVDDDLLLSRHAPALPELLDGAVIGLVPDPSQAGIPSGNILWVGNTGFILCKKESAPLFEAAVALGDQPGLPGHPGDQPAFNIVAWDSRPPMKLDWRWNFIPVADYFINNGGFERWISTRSWRMRFYASVLAGIGDAGTAARIKSVYGLHMTCCVHTRPVLRHFR